MTLRNAGKVLAIGSCLLLGCAAAPEAHDDGCDAIREPAAYGQTSAALSLATLANTNGCSTAGAEALSNQILDELLCLLDGQLVPVSHPNLVPSHPRVHLVLSPAARTALLRVASSRRLTINSALRTISEQYLLYRGCPVAADPGSSNHETGKAIDVDEYAAASASLQSAGFVYPLPSSDPVHFEGPGADLRSRSVLAFQRLWNDNRPNDRIDEDGVAGPMTLARLAQSPTEGFPLAGRCTRAPRTDAGTTDAGLPHEASAPPDGATDAGPTANDAGSADAGGFTDVEAADASADDAASPAAPPTGAEDDGGIGCAMTKHAPGDTQVSGAALVGFALAALTRRRRPRAASTANQ
jgi:MYXO-CTERM domain-containing protein